VLFKRRRGLNGVAAALVIATLALGGSHVPVADFPDNTPYIGLDWFILDLLGSTVIFAAIEKLFPLYKGQLIFRKEWQTDLVHFAVNHFIVGLALLTVNFAIHRLFGWMANDTVRGAVQPCTSCPQLLLCILAPTWSSTGPTAPTTRSLSCGASTRCTTRPRPWTGWPARASTSSN
jgi:sterol desaturase/sphingolipid hydroxylase (fatty acid hydroxylase superfamily)